MDTKTIDGKKRRHGDQKPLFFDKKKKRDIEKTEISELKEKKSKLDGIDADAIDSFAKLPLSRATLRGLKDEGFTEPTKVQRQSLVFSLRGLDVVAAAKTGSGKTLAFVIPLLESLFCNTWTKIDGLGALVITPTRELAYQIFEVLNKVGKQHDFSAGLVIGGKDLKYEWHRVSYCNIMICTPGRLLQHMTENSEFTTDNVQIVILDEADQCLSMGFADTMNSILMELPKEKQTLLFSATQTKDVKDLIRAGCHDPVFCSVHEHSKTLTPKSLKESYVVCSAHDKFGFLWSFIRHHRRHKILVFLATCKQVRYFYDIFCKLRPGLSVLALYGDMHQLRRMAVYDEFCRKQHAILFATDVAARGLDIPHVDWVIQADCPEDTTTYIHRAGRTARYCHMGESILLLTPSEEVAMAAHLRMKNIPVEKIDVNPRKQQTVITKMAAVLSKYVNLKEEAQRAFKAYLKNIALMRDKKVFDVASIDLDALARSYGLGVTPRVRFLEKRGIKWERKKPPVDGEPEAKWSEEMLAQNSEQRTKLTTLDFGEQSGEDDDEDFLQSNKAKYSSTNELEESNLEEKEARKKKKIKIVTKIAVAKKMLKKNMTLNSKVVFDEEGVAMLDPSKEQVSNAARENIEEMVGGIDISRLQQIMREEDRVDKKLHARRIKEKHWVEKEKVKAERSTRRHGTNADEGEGDDKSDSEVDDVTQDIIDELPDPDAIYGQSGSGSEEECDEDIVPKLKISGKRKARNRAREARQARTAQTNSLEDLPTDEKEQLALFLLRGGK